MKKLFRLSACFCAMMLLVTSCTKDVIEEQPNINPELVGTEIQFGARAGIENAGNTRTVYSDKNYQIGNKTFQLIEWIDYAIDETTGEVTGDMIEIFSPEASNGPSASYWVTGGSSNATAQKDAGVLVKVEEGALRWNGEGEHTFYGVYPSSNIIDGITFDTSTKMLTGVISDQQHTQGATISENEGGYTHYELKPDMRYAYMVAKTKVQGPQDAVSFDFLPVVTAIRIVLALPEDSANSLNVSAVELKGNGLTGTFTADLGDNWEWTPGETVKYPECKNTGTAKDDTINLQINVTDADGNHQPALLKRGETLAFTVFVRPGATINANSLTVRFSPDGLPNTYKSKAIGSSHVIQPLVKTSLENLWLPSTQVSINDYSDWMKLLDDETTMKGLSLPGAGGAFSSTSSTYKQQTLPFIDEDATDLWDMGIRAFEFSCDRPQESSPLNVISLADQDIEVNGAQTGWKVGTALESLLQKVTAEGSQETAMAIITYQPKGTNYNLFANTNNRHAYTFALCLAKLYDELNAKYPGKMLLYTPTTKLGDGTGADDARGKLMIICRVNQDGEPEPDDEHVNTRSSSNGATPQIAGQNYLNASNHYNNNNIPILLINGCGTAKDRWGKRGYKILKNGVEKTPPDLTFDISDETMEYYMLGKFTSSFSGEWTGLFVKKWDGSVVSKTQDFPEWVIEKKASNHKFDTNKDHDIWYNDWARVVDMDYIGTSPSTGMVADGYYYTNTHPTQPEYNETDDRSNNAIRWFASYDEKVADAIDTFNKAINSQNPGSEYSDCVFINSLSGYVVDPEVELSYQFVGDHNDQFDWSGGTRGNIAYLAQKLNPAFGGYVREVIASQEAGPTGVVLMDMVSSNPEDGASNYLPSVIISNNIYTGNVDIDKVEGDGDIDNPGNGGDIDEW